MPRPARLLALLLALGGVPAAAQTFERFGVREGLSSEAVTDLAFGADGVLWVATQDGLNRYDGHGFRTFRHRPGVDGSLPSSQIASVSVAPDGTVWVGTLRGLARLDPRTGRFARVPVLPRGVVASNLGVDAQAQVWIGTETRGLWRYSPGSGQAERMRLSPTAPQRERIGAMVIGPRGVWASAMESGNKSLCRIEDDACAPLPIEGAMFDVNDRALIVPLAADRLVWDDGEVWRADRVPEAFRVGVLVSPGEVWLAGDGIVVVRADGTTDRIRAEPDRRGGLGGHDVRALVRDAQGSVWVGTDNGLFVSRAPAGPFETFRHAAGDAGTLSDDRVNGMAEHDGALWVTTNDGLNRLDLATGRVRRFAALAPLADGSLPDRNHRRAFWQVLVTSRGEVLVGGKRDGLLRLDGDRLVRAAGSLPLAFSGVRGLLEDARGRVWVAAGGSLWRRERDGALRALAAPPGTISNTPYRAADGTLWLGTDGGLLRHDAATDRLAPIALACPDGEDVVNVWDVAETPRDAGALWLASMGSGLVRYAPATGAVDCVGLRQGLPTATVPSVLADADGRLWAGTSAGLVRLDPASREVTRFTVADGLQGDAFNLMAALRLADGRLAFGGTGGLTLVSPAEAAARRAPAVVISGFERAGRLDRGTPQPGDTLRLGHDANAFGVRFAAADFRAPSRHRYRYRLVGLDREWQRTDGTAPRAAYVGVPPGRYRFEVMGAAAGTPFGEPAALWIEVVPALWQRTRVRLAAGLLLALLALGGALQVARRRARKAARARADAVEVRRRLAEARERERLRLARDLHDGPVQNLYRVGHDLDRLGEAVGTDGVGPVRARVGDVARSLRGMLVELRPTLAEHLGLGAALRTVARHAEERHDGLAVHVHDDARGAALESGARVALFRIAQEALENVGRHAAASRADIALTAERRGDRGGVRLRVRDDGRGFAVPEHMVDLARREHFGLVGAQERAEAVGGHFVVRSAPGQGTTVDAWVPGAPEPDGSDGRTATDAVA